MPNNPPEQLGQKIGQAETEAGRIRDQYARSNFYISSTDKHHNKERVRLNEKNNTIRVPPFVWALVTKWVEDDATPYRTAADLIRDAVVHRLHDLQQLAERPPDAEWRGMRVQAEMLRRSRLAERYRDSIDDAKKMLQEAWTDGNMGLYNDLLADSRKLTAELPSPYKEMLERFLEDQSNLRRLNSSD